MHWQERGGGRSGLRSLPMFAPAAMSRSSRVVQSCLRAIELYSTRSDKEWDLIDCISFVVMQDHGITEALAADQHFVQAGFRALLRER